MLFPLCLLVESQAVERQEEMMPTPSPEIESPGFGASDVVIIVVILAALGAIGYAIWAIRQRRRARAAAAPADGDNVLYTPDEVQPPGRHYGPNPDDPFQSYDTPTRPTPPGGQGREGQHADFQTYI